MSGEAYPEKEPVAPFVPETKKAKRQLDPQRPGFLVKDATKKSVGTRKDKKREKLKAARKARRKNRK